MDGFEDSRRGELDLLDRRLAMALRQGDLAGLMDELRDQGLTRTADALLTQLLREPWPIIP
ncbi:MAG: hypothetical protein M3443_09035 [Actinomycetota bacterium]|nr:hypothetical protein [Actinomycetota bacterium]